MRFDCVLEAQLAGVSDRGFGTEQASGANRVIWRSKKQNPLPSPESPTSHDIAGIGRANLTAEVRHRTTSPRSENRTTAEARRKKDRGSRDAADIGKPTTSPQIAQISADRNGKELPRMNTCVKAKSPRRRAENGSSDLKFPIRVER